MRVLIVWFPAGLDIWGGGETVLSTILAANPIPNLEFMVATFTNDMPDIKLPIFTGELCSTMNYVLHHSFVYRRISYYNDLKRLSRSFRPDIVIQSGSCLFLPLTKLATSYSNSTLIYWDHGSLGRIFSNYHRNISDRLYKAVQRLLSKYAIQWADQYLCISSGIAEIIKKLYPGADTDVIFNPVKFPDVPLELPENDTINFIYVGRLDDDQKNISFILKCFSKISEMPWSLTIIGDGPDKNKLIRLASILDIPNKVSFLPGRRNPFSAVKYRSILLLTSRYEGFPMVLVEALSNGLPVISSDCPTGPRDIVQNYINGLLYKEGESVEFLKLVTMLIDKKISFKSSAELRESIRSFSSDIVIRSFYKAVCKSCIETDDLELVL